MKNFDDQSLIGKILWDKYKITKKIGQGSFGKIFQGINLITEELYAIKIEETNEKDELLEKEAIILYYLKGPGIPEIHLYDTLDNYHILIESFLGKSLEVLFSESFHNFSIKDVAMIAIQILNRLEYIHNKFIIHRDIKPDNFVIGQNPNDNKIYIIDFGLAKKYRSSKTLEHIKFRLTKKLTGTTRYASINALKGGEQSRRDDLESLAYMLFYFLRGHLPWQGAKGLTKAERYKKIYKIKKSTEPEELCENFPEEFKIFLIYVKNLEFEEDPNYDYLRSLFENVLKKMEEKLDYHFSWCKERIIINDKKFRNKKQNIKKNFIKKNINTKEKTHNPKESSNLINSMKSFNNKKQLINKISINECNNEEKIFFDQNYNNINKNDSDSNKVNYNDKEIIIRNNSTECRNINKKIKNFESSNNIAEIKKEKDYSIYNNDESINKIHKLNISNTSKQYFNHEIINKNKQKNNLSLNDEKNSKERKQNKKNVYENQINEYKNKVKMENIRTNLTKRVLVNANSAYFRYLNKKEKLIYNQIKPMKVNTNKKMINKKYENSTELTNEKKISLTRKNSINSRKIVNTIIKKEKNVNSLKYSPIRNNKLQKVRNIKNTFTNSELNIYSDRKKINMPKEHHVSNTIKKKEISVLLENNLNKTMKINNNKLSLLNNKGNELNIIGKKNYTKEKIFNINNEIKNNTQNNFKKLKYINNNLKNRLFNDDKNTFTIKNKNYNLLKNNISVNINPNLIYDKQKRKLYINKT